MTRRSLLLSPLPAFAAALVDADGMIYLDGKRTFLTGLYQLPQRADPWRAAADAGFQVVHCATGEDLDKARAHGMRGWMTVGAISAAKKDADMARIKERVEKFRSHPALLHWETEDEPSFADKKPRSLRVPPDAIRAAYRYLKMLDPERLVYLNHSPTHLVSTLRQYNPGGDIIATDVYPVIPHGIRNQYALWPDGRQGDLLNGFVSQTGQYVDKMKQVAGSGRAVWMVLQAFAWEMLRKEADRDPKMIRYPTRDDMRFQAWQSIVHGASGLLWWGLTFTPRDVSLWDELVDVMAEIKALRAELAAPAAKLALTVDYHETGHSLDRGIEWIAKPSGGGILLAAVNADPNPVDATLSGLSRYTRARVLNEGRSVRFANGSLRDEFPPFGVRLFRLE